MNATFQEDITKAAQCASLLIDDLRAAHRTAATSGDVAGELAVIFLESALGEARQLADKLKRIQDAIT